MSATVYAESSAIVAWLLGEDERDRVMRALATAARVVTARLTLVECARAIAHARREHRLDDVGALAAQQLLEHAAAEWTVIDLVGEVMTRAASSFPVEPVRSLDALHLAAAVVFNRYLESVQMLTLDDRIRANAVALGMSLAL